MSPLPPAAAAGTTPRTTRPKRRPALRFIGEGCLVTISVLVGLIVSDLNDVDDGVVAAILAYGFITVARYARWAKAHNIDVVRFLPEAAVFAGILTLAYGLPMDVTP